jgi:ATP-binding cassette subfamily G (WHITE) protein 2 (SNQ2)
MSSFSHPCTQNFGITVAFGIAFLAAYFIITEFKSKIAEARSVVTFKRGTTKINPSAPEVDDVEKANITRANSTNDLRGDDVKTEKALATAERMTDTFSWEGLNYTVPISGGEERKLLNDVSGYVVPGKLTALMGESGAGKVRPPLSINFTELN